MTTARLTVASGCLVPPAQLELLTFGSDVALRARRFTRVSFTHPAKLHLGLLCRLAQQYTRPGEAIAERQTGKQAQ